MDSGKDPTSSLELTSNTVSLSRNPSSEGKQPFSPLFVMMISLRVSFIFPKLEGKQLLRLLLAKTMTDAVESPMFSGREERNPLLLTKTASSFTSKRRDGMSPLNLLNLMSRYLREGRERTTVGNLPENWLLLMSSSYRSLRHEKDFGIVPFKRLELMWKRDKSVKRPNSSGNEPAISDKVSNFSHYIWINNLKNYNYIKIRRLNSQHLVELCVF